MWRHTRFGDMYVTVVIDLTPTREKTGSITPAGRGRRPLEEGVQDLARCPNPRGWQGAATSGRNLAEVRRWARESGLTVSDRGRVSAEIMTAYQQRAQSAVFDF